jgi:hypothetical protein
LAGQQAGHKAKRASDKRPLPDGKHWEDVSLQLGQIFVRNREYATAIEYYSEILKTKPEHAYKDQIFTCGFCQFQDGFENLARPSKPLTGLPEAIRHRALH